MKTGHSFINNSDIMLFSKHVVKLPINQLCEQLQANNISALDLTVRSGGHVEPTEVQSKLPEIHEQLVGKGIRIGMITTDITDAFAPETENILKTASDLGIKYYKLGYYMYKGFGTLKNQREEVKAALKGIVKLNEKYGMCAGFHNHSANFFGANLADEYEVIQEYPKELIGSYFDPAHAVIEGGCYGWEMSMDLLSDRIVMLAVKDFRWAEKAKGYEGGRIHAAQFCPLENGNVPWNRVLVDLKKINFQGPISFHSEYQSDHCWPVLPDEKIVEQTAQDIAFFKHQTEPTN